jgi:negative regulator of sigma E activity
MTEHAGELNLEALLADALRPIEPPEDLATRVQATLANIAEQAAAELSNWADELSESELQSLRDPRNWVRPVVAVGVGAAAAAALVVVESRRRRRPGGVRDTASRWIRDLT